MNDSLQNQAIQRIEMVSHHLLVDLMWIAIVCLVPLFLFIFFNKAINRAIEGYFWHKGREFNLDEEIVVNDKLARLVRYSSFKTTFYVYVIDPEYNIPIFSDRLTVSNDKLTDLIITKKIPNHDRPNKLKPIHKQ